MYYSQMALVYVANRASAYHRTRYTFVSDSKCLRVVDAVVFSARVRCRIDSRAQLRDTTIRLTSERSRHAVKTVFPGGSETVFIVYRFPMAVGRPTIHAICTRFAPDLRVGKRVPAVAVFDVSITVITVASCADRALRGRPSAVYAAERNAENCIPGLGKRAARAHRGTVTLVRTTSSVYVPRYVKSGRPRPLRATGRTDSWRADARGQGMKCAPTAVTRNILTRRRRDGPNINFSVAGGRHKWPPSDDPHLRPTLPVRVTGNSKASPMEFCRSVR